MSFQQGLSGLNSSSKALDVVSNNISNANTVGFKSSATHFADVYANSLAGAGASQVGIGVQTAAIMQQFSQGNISSTNNPLDMSINGGGFYRMSTNGNVTYSRIRPMVRGKSFNRPQLICSWTLDRRVPWPRVQGLALLKACEPTLTWIRVPFLPCQRLLQLLGFQAPRTIHPPTTGLPHCRSMIR